MPPQTSVEELASLYNIRLLRLNERGLVLQGTEEHWRRKQGTDYPQAWWCWPAKFPDESPDPIYAEEEGEQVADAIGEAAL